MIVSTTASDVLNHLCSFPTIAHKMVTAEELRTILKQTDGDVFVNGVVYSFSAEPQGAEMYDLRLKRKAYD